MTTLLAMPPVSAEAAVGMAATSLVMVLTPGPNMMYLASRSIGQGRRAGLVSLAGTGAGFMIYMLMANLGLAVVFVAVPWLFIGFKAAGVVYLASLAWQALRPSGSGVFEVRHLTTDSDCRLFRMGLLTNLLNPKAAIMYLTLIVIGAGSIARFVEGRPGWIAWQRRLSGALIAGVAILLAREIPARAHI